MKALLLTVLLLSSCTKYAPLSKDAVGIRLSEVAMNITRLIEIEWLVGKRKESTITQSFVFTVDLPKVKEEDLRYLSELKGIDSWIVRLVVQRGSERQDLGSLFARFRPKKLIRGQGNGAPSNVSLKVYYAAGYASERFRYSRCPPLDHNRRITSMKIINDEKPIEILIDEIIPYPEKTQAIQLSPSAFNGGLTLKGTYFVEIAPFESMKKVIHGPFRRIPSYVEVLDEERIPLPSCMGIETEVR
jgi:hypothetical protein